MGDNVNHPNHYQNIAGLEAIDILNDVVKDLPGKQAAMLWNTLKYLLRFQKKNGLEDLKKAQNYLQRLIDEVDGVKVKPKNPRRSNLPKNQGETPWGMWYSKKYGDIRIYLRSSNLNGMPSKLTFDTADAAEEFKKILKEQIEENVNWNLIQFMKLNHIDYENVYKIVNYVSKEENKEKAFEKMMTEDSKMITEKNYSFICYLFDIINKIH